MFTSPKTYYQFPSLTGVIHFLIYSIKNSDRHIIAMTFPSLTGVIHFLIKIAKNTSTNTGLVSVPYRGYSFFNFDFNNAMVALDEIIKFPSLTGVIHFLIIQRNRQKHQQKSFRPLQGLFIF